MPLHMDIVPIQRLVVIVAHGEITADDLANNVKELIEARVANYAKIIDVSSSHWVLTREQIDAIAGTLLFHSLHQARRWLEDLRLAVQHAPSGSKAGPPARRGVH
jgi:hypothetical protein